MSIWLNNDTANSKPLLPVERQVREIISLTTQNVTSVTSNTIVFQQIGGSNSIPSGIVVGSYVYSTDANTAASRLYDGSIIDTNNMCFLQSNNTVALIDSANSLIRLANTLSGNLAVNSLVFFANAISFRANTQANTYFSDTILVTPSRIANSNVSSGAVANLSSFNQGWNHIQKKTNNDGSVRYLVETLVALANTSAANTKSGNTSFGLFLPGI
jgi:sugar lactone lactonase YvrE